MMLQMPGKVQTKGVRALLLRLVRDRRGVGAIEFAILVPVLLMLYLGALEITIGLSVAKRASRAAGSIADIITQQTSVTKSFLGNMPPVARAVFAPYGVTGLTLKVTGIAVDSNGKASVAWSWAADGTTPYSTSSTPDIPANMNQAGSFLVRT